MKQVLIDHLGNLLMGIILLIIFIGEGVFAKDTLELMGPGLTYHLMDGGASYLYSSKYSEDGRWIYTPSIGLRKMHVDKESVYMSFTAFRSNNSIGSPIWGAIGGTGVQIFSHINLGLAYGGYIQNNEDFRYKNITPFSATGGVNAFVPLLGFNVDFQIPLSDKTFIGFNNLITPVITNHTLSVGLEY